MRYYLFACTENGNPGESPTTMGLTIKRHRLEYAAWMIDSEDQPDIVDIFQFTAPTLGWRDHDRSFPDNDLELDMGVSITFGYTAGRIISELESEDHFSRPENMVERIKQAPETILNEVDDILDLLIKTGENHGNVDNGLL